MNPTIRSSYCLDLSKNEMQFLLHVLDQHRKAHIDDLMEIDETTDYDKPFMAEIQMSEDMINMILRKITETHEKVRLSSLYGKIGMDPKHRDDNEVQL